MSRAILEEAQIHPDIINKIAAHNQEIIEEVQRAVTFNKIVIVGMAVNPHPKRARKLLNEKGISHKYLEYGSYLSGWRRRTALKMWTGWPTFPMIFVQGSFIGGADELQRLSESGELERMLEKTST
jgi:monothiol glutaredoxin